MPHISRSAVKVDGSLFLFLHSPPGAGVPVGGLLLEGLDVVSVAATKAA